MNFDDGDDDNSNNSNKKFGKSLKRTYYNKHKMH